MVSVILPCYNVAEYIGTAIDSLKAQTFENFEALVVNDGSTDASADIVRAAIAGDARFRLLSQRRQGLSGARNTGLNQASGTYVAFLDGDDWFAPEFLSHMVRTLEETGADWAASALWLEFDTGSRFAHSAIHGAPDITGAARACHLDDARMVARHFPSAWNKLYRRDFIGDLRFVPGAVYEDHPFYWALACRSDQMWYVPEPLYHHRRGRHGQITAQGDRQIFEQFDRLDEVRALMDSAGMPHRRCALSRLATRLVHERLQPVTDPALRRAFIDRAGAYFAAHDLTWDWDGASDIDLRPGPEISPSLRYTVLVQAGDGADQTRRALAAQRLPPTGVLELADGPVAKLFAQARPSIQTPWCAILKAGDTPLPDWSAKMLGALQEPADATLAVCAVTRGAQGWDPGFALPDLPCPDPAALIFATALPPSASPDGPDWATGLRFAVAHGPTKTARVEDAMMVLAPRPTDSPRATVRTLRQMVSSGLVSPRQAAALFAHLAQLAVSAQAGRARRVAHALIWGVARRAGRLPKPPQAAHIGKRLHRLL
ncbi:glycosyltransferase family 2 protein [Roseibaca calidilacus]|nr:glycosyltransferase family 2 protein [Roseibaca calidilacus]